MSASLVGSEMCIRDSTHTDTGGPHTWSGSRATTCSPLSPAAQRTRPCRTSGPFWSSCQTRPRTCPRTFFSVSAQLPRSSGCG
eukprot:2398030-Alexandrium_andersonii.AAC.1